MSDPGNAVTSCSETISYTFRADYYETALSSYWSIVIVRISTEKETQNRYEIKDTQYHNYINIYKYTCVNKDSFSE